MSKALLLFNTIKYLRFRQIAGRISHKLHQIKIDLSPAPALSTQKSTWMKPASRNISMLDANRFLFLNVSAAINTAADWNAPTQEKLWLYNLHYFDDLNAKENEDRQQWHTSLVQRWIDENPVGSGNGWEAYPSSLRIVNWIKWSLSGTELNPDWKHSLAIQVRYLSQQLEVHLLGNHLFVNAKALVFAGLYFDGIEADKWLETGLTILAREIPEQILEDGGQFELSPMYHSIALEDMLDLHNICTTFPDRIPKQWKKQIHSFTDTIGSMQEWMQVMNHPDNKVSFFNDSAFNIAPSAKELAIYAKRLDITPSFALDDYKHLEDSGYIRVKNGDFLALLDVARIGPDYLPGHAHADTLSFELSVYGIRVLVNSGTSCYGATEERLRQRGTAAHNTVLINKNDSSEVWSGFRVARRAKPFNLTVNTAGKDLNVICSHNGYQRLKGQPIHQRNWLFKPKELYITDTITGDFSNAEARFHFNPDILIESQKPHTKGVISVTENKKLYWEVLNGKAKLETSTYHPEFGLSFENKCLTIYFQGNETEIRFYY